MTREKFTVVVDHASLEPGQVGSDRRNAYTETFHTPLAAALALLAQIEGGGHVPPRRHGYLFIRVGRSEYAFNAFVKAYALRSRIPSWARPE